MYWNKRVGVLVLLAMLLTACGNKGPLVMPGADNVIDNNVEKTERELIN